MSYAAYVKGIGITEFGKHLHRSVRQMTETAVNAALKDAGISADMIDEIYFGNAASGLITGQEMIRGQAALRDLGFRGKPIINVENACASSSTAFFLAYRAIMTGQAEYALVVGAEKLTHEDRAVSIGVFSKAVDLEEPQPESIGKGAGSMFMDLYAEKTRKYMANTGASSEDFANIVVKSRRAGALNPHAQFRTTTTVEEVLNARMISSPLTLPMCSAIGDGATAIVLCSANALKKNADSRAVAVAGSVLISGKGASAKNNCATEVSNQIYQKTGISPADLHVVELHDASAPAELMHYENLGLCPAGEGPALLRSGATDLGGRISVNPSGGLLSRGHPIGATGAAQIYEIVSQLRGEAGPRQRPDARVGMAENNGGSLDGDSAAAVATIFVK